MGRLLLSIVQAPSRHIALSFLLSYQNCLRVPYYCYDRWGTGDFHIIRYEDRRQVTFATTISQKGNFGFLFDLVEKSQDLLIKNALSLDPILESFECEKYTCLHAAIL